MTKINKAKKLIEKLSTIIEDDNVEVLESSSPDGGDFSMRAYDPTTQKSLFKATAKTPAHVKSLLGAAAKHMTDGGMSKIRVTVQHNKSGLVSDHTMTKLPDGKIHTKGPDPETYFSH